MSAAPTSRAIDLACDVARGRRGTWFDPRLVDAVAGLEHDVRFWASLIEPDVAAHEPADRIRRADDDRLDRVAEAFAQIVDAESPFTARHSAGVAEIAVGIATVMGADKATLRLLRRAGLLHDVGKLGVSNRILDKPGKLDEAEWAEVRRHPELSATILEAVPARSCAPTPGPSSTRPRPRSRGRGRRARALADPEPQGRAARRGVPVAHRRRA